MVVFRRRSRPTRSVFLFLRHALRGKIVKRLLLVLVATAASVSAQTAARRATNLAALLAYPAFYHGRPIVLIGNVTTDQNGHARVSDDNGSVRLVLKTSALDGLDEIRGEFWDISRMKPDDPRFSAYDLRKTFELEPDSIYRPEGDDFRSILGTQSPGRPARGPGEKPVRLRAAIRRRGDLGDQHAAEGEGLRPCPRRTHRHQPLAHAARHRPKRARP